MATVIELIELKDGGAEITLELDKDETALLLQDAITRALQNYIMFESLKDIGD